MMKKLILALMCLLSLTACTAQKDSYTVELITKGDLSVDFWESVYQGAKAAADIYGLDLVLTTPSSEENYEEQIELLYSVSLVDTDIIILAASDYTLLAEPVQNVAESGIPIVIVDSDVDNESTVAYIGTDNEELGNVLAEKLIESVEVSGQVGIVSFVKDSHTAVLREQGFREVLEEYDMYEILDTVYGNSDVETSKELTIELIENNPDLVAIAALNDPSIEGVCAALEYFPDREIQVFAIDCTPKQVPYMENGIIDYSLLQNPYQMGYYAVETAYNYLEGVKNQENIYTDIYAVDASMVYEDLYQQLIFPFE